MMYPGLHITDLTPAAGETYYRNRSWCVEKGATLHPQPVNLFDYKHMLSKNSDADLPATFDLVVCFGLCFNIFGTAGHTSAPVVPTARSRGSTASSRTAQCRTSRPSTKPSWGRT